MKKAFFSSVLIALCLVISLCTISVFAGISQTPIFSDNYENYNGGQPDNYLIEDGGVLTLAESLNGHTKSIKLFGGTTNGGVNRFFKSDQSGVSDLLTFEGDFYVPQGNDNMYMSMYSSENYGCRLLYFEANNIFVYKGNGNLNSPAGWDKDYVCNFTRDTWNHFKIVSNFGTHTIDVYLNENQILTNFSMNNPISNAKLIWFADWNAQNGIYLDNISAYSENITNAKNITVSGSGATVDWASDVLAVNGHYMANVGETVVFTITPQNNNCTVSNVTVSGAQVTELGGYYTFEMPSGDVSISYTVLYTLTNLMPDGDIESGSVPSSVAGASHFSVATEDKKSGSKSLKYVNPNGGYSPFNLFSRLNVIANNTYYYSYWANSSTGTNLWRDADKTSLYIYKGWSKYYGTISGSLLSALYAPVGNEGATIYFDDIELYDITTAKNINVSSQNANIEWISGTANVNGQCMANASSVVEFKVNANYDFQVKDVLVDNKALSAVDGVYSLTIADNTTITITTESLPTFTNVTQYGNMESMSGINTFSSDSMTVSYVTLSDNKVLWMQQSAYNVVKLAEGLDQNKTYYYKVDAISKDGSWENLWASDLNTSFGIIPDCWSTLSGTFTGVTEMRAFLADNSGSVYFDNLEIYDITNAKKITIDRKMCDVDIEGSNILKDFNGYLYAKPGTSITFTVSGIPEEYALNVSDALTKNADGTLTYTIGQNDAMLSFIASREISLGKNVSNVSALTFHQLGTRSILVAKYNSNKMTNVWLKDITTTEDDQTIALDGSFSNSIGDLTGAKVFCWNNMQNMIPLCDNKKVVPQAKVFFVGDSTCVDYTNGNANLIQGWGYYLKDMFNSDATISIQATGGATITSFLSGNEYANAKNNWKSGDYVLLSLGINDTSSVTPADFTDGLNTFINEAKKAGVNVVLCTPQKTLVNSNTEFSGYMKNVAASQGLVCIDLNTDSQNMSSVYWIKDQINPNHIGAEYLAKRIFNLLSGSSSDLKYYLK